MISLVMTYFNRREQLLNTLKSIERSAIKDYEIILVDDCSDQRIDDIPSLYPKVKLIRLEKADKWYVNSLIPFNMGIAKATGDIVILQNSECLHVHDIMTYVINNLTDDNFLSISAYAPDEKNSKLITDIPPDKLESWVMSLPQQTFYKIGWYNHPIYRPVYYHFCSAITKKNLDLLGGFDERYSMGIARDDVEFVDRVDRLGLKKIIPTEVMVIHQWHTKVAHYSEITHAKGHERNIIIYKTLTAKENSIFKENRYAT